MNRTAVAMSGSIKDDIEITDIIDEYGPKMGGIS